MHNSLSVFVTVPRKKIKHFTRFKLESPLDCTCSTVRWRNSKSPAQNMKLWTFRSIQISRPKKSMWWKARCRLQRFEKSSSAKETALNCLWWFRHWIWLSILQFDSSWKPCTKIWATSRGLGCKLHSLEMKYVVKNNELAHILEELPGSYLAIVCMAVSLTLVMSNGFKGQTVTVGKYR